MMTSIVVHALILLLSTTPVTVSSEGGKDDLTRKKELHLAVLLPFSGAWKGGESLQVAIDIALQQVNEKNVIPGYRLVRAPVWDTECDPGWGLKGFFENIFNPPLKIAILGACCSPVSEAIAQVSHHYNLVQLSVASVSPSLSDKKRFPLFARVASSDVETNPARIRFFQHFNWTKIAVFYQDHEVFSKTVEDLIRKIKEQGMEILRTEVFTEDPSVQVKDLKEHDCRIIVGAFYADKARKVMCEAYKQGLYGPHVVWVLTNWIGEKWWKEDDPSVNCTKQQLQQAAEGYFDAGIVYINPKDEKSISGLRPSDWLKLYTSKTNNKALVNDLRKSQGTDAVWAMALALNAVRQQLIDQGDTIRLENFTYNDTKLSQLLYNKLLNVSFTGIRGPIRFRQNGDLDGSIKLDRFQGGMKKTVAWYCPNKSYEEQLVWVSDNPIKWRDGVVPSDSRTKRTDYVKLSTWLYVTMCVLASLGILLNCGFLAFNILLRNVKLIKMSSPNLNNAILVGCVCAYATVFAEDVQACMGILTCYMRIILMVVGVSLAFGALFAKTWRVYLIFTNTKMERKILTDAHLLSMVGALLLANISVIAVWSLVDPLQVVSEGLCSAKLVAGAGGGVDEEEWCQKSCSSTHYAFFFGALTSILGLLLIFGVFLAYETRNVHYKELNDSRSIGMCIYLVSVLSIPVVVLNVALKPGRDVEYGIRSGLIFLGTTLVQIIIFLPKIKAYRDHGQRGSESTPSLPFSTPGQSRVSD